MAIKIGEAIKKMERLKFEIQHPLEFYRENEDRFRGLAEREARRALLAIRPPGIPPEVWDVLAQSLAEKVTSFLLQEGNITGIRLALDIPDGKGLRKEAGLPGDGAPSLQDIEDWVEAGRSKTGPEEPGKNLTEFDEGKTDKQIAWRVLFAIRLQKSGWRGLVEAVEEFKSAERIPASMDLATVILQAWVAFFSTHLPVMWKQWVNLKVTETF